MSTAIAISELTKRFGAGATQTTAVDAISLSIAPGELFFLLGPSGCGKTTLLRMIAGFIEPTSGRVLFDSKDVTYTAPNARNTGMVFQSYALWPHMTVEANVAFGLGVRRVPRPEQARRVGEALQSVRMAEYAGRKPNHLSGGQQQRVALARALVIRPSVLLLDEPLSNLDAKLRIELRSEIRRVCKESGITTVYVTHDQKEALSMADRVAIIDRGRVVQLGAPGELYRNPASKFVAEFLGETNFIPATVLGRGAPGARADGGPDEVAVTLQTAAGRLTSTHPSAGHMAERASVLCSIRPEALRVVRGELAGPNRGASAGLASPTAAVGNTLPGTLIDTMYLGELAQYTVELAGSVRVKAAQLNPAAAGSRSEAGAVTLTVASADVALVPA
jgi:iron(III) transport system ATP-binding protein